MVKEPYRRVIINKFIEEMTNSHLEFPVSLGKKKRTSKVVRVCSTLITRQSNCLLPLNSKGCDNRVIAKLVLHMELYLAPQQYGHESQISLHQ